ncbi:hypothetical protein TR75_12805 [Hydrogenibacillus schlegelii]|nr:hypothetical protein TR75_12805 [Hydrogenibacillus schlegelii]
MRESVAQKNREMIGSKPIGGMTDMTFSLRDLVRQSEGRLHVLAGEAGLDRPFSSMAVCDRPPKACDFSPGGLYYFPATLLQEVALELDVLVRRLSARGSAGMLLPEFVSDASGEIPSGLPRSALLLADRLKLPVLYLRGDFLSLMERWVALRQDARLFAARRLERALDALIQAWRDEQAVEGIVGILEEALDGRIVVHPDVTPGHRAVEENTEQRADIPALDEAFHRPGVPVVRSANGRVQAYLLLQTGRRYGAKTLIRGEFPERPHQREVVERAFSMAAPILQLQLEKRLLDWELRLRSRLDVVREILMSEEPIRPEAVARARSFGWDIFVPHAVVYAGIARFGRLVRERRWTEADVLRRESEWIDRIEAAAAERGWWALGVSPESGHFLFVFRRRGSTNWGIEEVRHHVADLFARQGPLWEGVPIGGGIGRPGTGVDGHRRSYRESVQSFHLGVALYGEGTLKTVTDLGAEAYLYPWYRSREALGLIEAVLGPLFRLPENRRQVLLETAEAVVEAHGDLRRAAERLHVHRNTVRYRKRQGEEVLGMPLDDPERLRLVGLALRAYRLQGLSRTEEALIRPALNHDPPPNP